MVYPTILTHIYPHNDETAPTLPKYGEWGLVYYYGVGG